MSLETGEKRPKVGGRTKGTPNKVSAVAKENIVAVFTRLGSTAAMAEWAKENLTEFYKIYARLLPTEVEGDLNAHLTVLFDNPVETRPPHMNGSHRKPIEAD